MNKQEFLNIFPNDREIAILFNGEYSTYKIDPVSFTKGVNAIKSFILDKLSDFTEAEKLAIEEYKTNKLSAVKFLMSESKMGLKQAKDFLDKYSNE
jgi:ribosomal protein L7/L12